MFHEKYLRYFLTVCEEKNITAAARKLELAQPALSRIIRELEQEAGLPLLVGLSGSTVAGFTGPVRPEPCGRGYFAGIAVGPQWRGHGLGKLLFYRLLQAEQAAGALYMTLFTGVDNPAGRMYRKAGFRDVRTFAAMEKELAEATQRLTVLRKGSEGVEEIPLEEDV